VSNDPARIPGAGGYGRRRPQPFLPEHFATGLSPAAARALLRAALRKIHIEIFSYCNRRCGYCPVALVDRRSVNNHMPDALFDKALAELAAIDYDGDVSFSLFNEPLADRIVLARARALKAALPRAFLYINSNGDSLDRDYLRDLEAAGVDQLTVTLHLAPGAPYDEAEVDHRVADLARRTGVALATRQREPGIARHEVARTGRIVLAVYARDFIAIGTDRGGLVRGMAPAPERVAPCDRPFGELAISYDGTVFPCCQLFADAREHDRYRVGSLADSSLAALFAADAMAQWRRGLLTYGPKHAPCATCRENDVAGTPARIAERQALYDRLVAPPRGWRQRVARWLRGRAAS